MTLTLRISEVPDLGAEKVAKKACENIVELAQQSNSARSTISREPVLEYNTPVSVANNSCYIGHRPASTSAHGSFPQSLGEIESNMKSLMAFIEEIPDNAAKGIPPAKLKIIDFNQALDLPPRTLPYKISKDVSPRETSLESFIANSPDAIVTTTPDGFICTFNQNAERLFGYMPKEVESFHIAMLLETSSVSGDVPANSDRPPHFRWQPASAESPIRGRKKTGELFPIEVIESQYAQNGITYRLYYIRDLSLSSRQEQRIAELECEIAYLSRHSVLGELATTITHELSQPLTAITNYTAAAVRCLTQPLQEQRDSGLDLIVKAGDQAKRAWLIMHRLRKLLQHRGIECVRDDLRGAIEEAVQLATLGSDRHGIQVSVELPPEPVMVSMDRVHIQVLVTNLIRNAIDELSVSAGEKAVWVRLRVLEGNLAELSVEDTGAGIAPEIYENIFDPFHTTKPQGLGVGLAVSRRIAQAHGGRLSAENRPEGGAVFRFVVPVSMSEKAKNE